MKTINTINTKLMTLFTRAAARKHRGDFVWNHAVVAVMVVVLGILALGLVTTYVQGDFSTSLTAKMNELFA